MKGRLAVFILTALIVLSWSGFVRAQAEWDVQRTFDLENATPLDVQVSGKGKYVFVLTNHGEVLIYTPAGTLEGKISVGESIDAIEPGPVDDVLLISSQKKKTLEVITLDFIQNIDISDAPFKGPADASVALAFYADFQSSACADLASVLDQVLEKYPDKVKLVYKSFPARTKDRFAGRPTVAAMAAERQGKFWEFYDLLFENYRELNQKKVDEFVEKLGLKKEKFREDARDPVILSKIQEDMAEGAVAGVRVPPAVFINGKKVRNTTPEGLEEAIHRELKKMAKK